MSSGRTIFLYGVFGFISMFVNLAVQWISTRFYHGVMAIELSILLGTAAGLPVKYALDRRYIFVVLPRVTKIGWEFLCYTATGVITTLVFWLIEWSFHLMFGTEFWRLLGGALGLSAGFVLKYQLDKRFVFTARVANGEAAK
jgi:putative flippase GtrA